MWVYNIDMKEINKNQFIEIKEFQEDGGTSNKIASKFKITLLHTAKVMRAETYDEYLLLLKGKKIDQDKLNKIAPVAKGYFRGLVAKKYEENEILTETRDGLSENVKALWKMIKLLESRKKYLEGQIYFMEDYMKKGTNFIEDHVEE